MEREGIHSSHMNASMPGGARTWGDVIEFSLKDSKCRPLEDATKRLKRLYSGQVLSRERGALVLDNIDPQSLLVL
jgi:hypothetical protein